MGGSSFEQLMGELFNQKQFMDELLAENYELRRQLADLRDGRGIFLEIQGQRYSLDGELVDYAPRSETISQEAQVAEQATTIMPVSEAAIGAGILPETPVPGFDQFEQIPYSIDKGEEKVPTSSSSFLEEMLVDEFAAAATSPMAVWKGSKTRKLVAIEEEEKAALRKQLVGSYILE